MKNIVVKVLDHNLYPISKFLAKITQRGHLLKNMDDVMDLYDKEIESNPPSEAMMTLPHTTLRRMNYITIAIFGLSTKALTQFRTHAKRLTFVTTSTQYSDYSNCKDICVIPDVSDNAKTIINNTIDTIFTNYCELIKLGVDKDEASYILPQSLRKVAIISGNLDDWEYVLTTRLCSRNTKETRLIANAIVKVITDECGPEYTVNMKPNCKKKIGCLEGKFTCKQKVANKQLVKGYATDAGVDVILKEDATFLPMSTCTINLKITCTPDENVMSYLCARTSAAAKGLVVAQCPIDPHFTGEVTAIVHNVSNHVITYSAGEAFCQIVTVPFIDPPVGYTVKREGKRGAGKLGSTGGVKC